DEFGQILTAVGAMLSRVGRRASMGTSAVSGTSASLGASLGTSSSASPPSSAELQADLREVQETVQATLNNVRSLSQALHPVILDEAGLESTVEWYIPTVERQTGIAISYEKSGTPFPVDGTAGIHIYRVLQEALNNVVRHSGAQRAWVRLRFLPQALELEVEDHGAGIQPQLPRQGIGLVAMRERAELLGGSIEFLEAREGGTLVRLKVTREKLD